MNTVLFLVMGLPAIACAGFAAVWFTMGVSDVVTQPAGRVRIRVRALARETDYDPADYGRAKLMVQAAALGSKGLWTKIIPPLLPLVKAADKASIALDAQRMRQAGLSTILDPDDMMRVRVVYGVVIAAVLVALMLGGGAVNAVFFGLVGFFLGARLPSFTLARTAQERVQQATRDLPEMIDMIALASRAGMSFDAALTTYCERFQTSLAKEFGIAAEKWKVGAVTREGALDEIAEGLEVDALTRFVAAVLQALRLGAPLAKVLEEQAGDARKSRKSSLEELIAKAPVKMFLPMGLLILPAMLILMLGPVVLQLVSGLSGM